MFRIKKVNALLKREIGKIILRDLELGSDILITISDIDTSSDLSASKVKITIMPELKSQEILREINKHLPAIQTQLFRKLKMRLAPKIRFEIDKQARAEQRVYELLEK